MNTTTSYDIELQDDSAVIRIVGDLDHFNAPALRTSVTELMDKGIKSVTLDMTDVAFMDSGGMSTIIYLMKRLSTLGGRLTLSGCNPRVYRKLEIGGLTKLQDFLTVCGIEPSPEEEASP